MQARGKDQYCDWSTSLVIDAFDLPGRRVPIVVGVIGTQGGPHIAMQLGDGTAVILSDQAVAQLIVSLREAILERLRVHNRGDN